MKYFVRIKRDLPNKIGGLLRFGPIATMSEARIIAAHESREPKTHWVKVVDEKNAVRYHIVPHGGEYSTNPAKRKGTTKVNRVSQITKKKPTKRLVARRKANTEKGYFPNPTKKKKFYIVHEHKEGVLYYDGVGFTKLKSSAADFQNAKNAVTQGKKIADIFKVRVKAVAD